MAATIEKILPVALKYPGDPIWDDLRKQAGELAAGEPALASFVHATILNHNRLEEAVSYHLAKRIGGEDIDQMLVREIFSEAMEADPEIGAALRADLAAVFARDPACHAYIEAFLYFKGFHALQSYRVAHWLWSVGRIGMAMFFQSRISRTFDVDIHPAARMGRGIHIDHATGVVIGETAVVEDDVSLFHNVTLGGTGKEKGDRHPKIRRGVLLSMGVKVLGNIEVGEYSRIGAGSVVLKSIPAHCTAVGVPAKVVGGCCDKPTEDMSQMIDDPEIDIKAGI